MKSSNAKLKACTWCGFMGRRSRGPQKSHFCSKVLCTPYRNRGGVVKAEAEIFKWVEDELLAVHAGFLLLPW